MGKKFFLIIILISLVISLYYFQVYQSTVKGFSSNETVNLKIEYGTSVKKYISILKENGIIKTEWPVLIYLKWYNKTNNLQAGNFIITKGESIPKLIKILSNAHAEEIAVKILEGYTIEDINQVLLEVGLIKNNELIDCIKTCDFSNYDFIKDNDLEGYLFPNTYFVDKNNFDTKMFINRLLDEFKTKILTEENIIIYKSQNRTLKDMVIMASMIEKEERNDKNRPIVSGILWKRLNEKIHLGVDATTRYYAKNKNGVLTNVDFNQDNPYNTRKKLGLPPTAISNFGLQAWKSTLFPELSPYYYYLHDNNGQIHYATTNDEHNKNKYKYLN